MCSVVILRRPGHRWPLILAGNRDEQEDRPWRAPARHWPDRPNVVGGLDELAGGSWLALNDDGVLAVALNRAGTLGPAEGKRSRGEVVLEAVDHADAAPAAEALAQLSASAYRPFNLVIADDRDAYLLCHRDGTGRTPITVEPIPEGLSMVTAFDLNDPIDPRLRRFLPAFRAAAVPEPEADRWESWQHVLADRRHDPDTDARGALCFRLPCGFGTSSSALIALPTRAVLDAPRWPRFLFAPGPPDRTAWMPVPLDTGAPPAPRSLAGRQW